MFKEDKPGMDKLYQKVQVAPSRPLHHTYGTTRSKLARLLVSDHDQPLSYPEYHDKFRKIKDLLIKR